jgi:hypothetical protein
MMILLEINESNMEVNYQSIDNIVLILIFFEITSNLIYFVNLIKIAFIYIINLLLKFNENCLDRK